MQASEQTATKHAPASEPAAAGLAFVLAVSANPSTGSPLDLVCVAASVTAGVAIARRSRTSRTAVLVGTFVALVALWLVPQRDDLASAVILAFLFGVGAGLVFRHPHRGAHVVAGVVAAVLLLTRIVASQRAVLVLTAIAVICGCVSTMTSGVAAATSRATRLLLIGLVAVTGFFTMYVGAETPGASWFGGGITHGPTTGREVALTFDDGPDATSTLEVMAILDRYGVKGTFFEVGKAVDAEPQITRELSADGHLIGNHSYHHDQWRWLDPRYPELERDQRAIRRAAGVCPALYRPPHGDRTPFLARVVHDHHMHMILWNVSAGDWATTDAHLVADRILRQAKPGAILLLHDGLDGNPTADRRVVVEALPLILDGLRARHLVPVRLDRLLGLRPYTNC